jgi:hypothetical protein
MGRTKTVKPPTPMAPPPPVEEVDAEFIAPTMRQLAARRARRGAYITGTERRLGGKPRVSGKEASAIADKTVRELDPLKGFETPTRKQTGTRRGKATYESDLDFEVRAREEEAKFLEKGATSAGVEKLKSKDEFVNPKGYPKMKGSLAAQKIYREKTAYSKYLSDYLDKAKGRMKAQYRTTQLRNLGLM